MKTWGKGKVKRLLGAGAGLIFKGSGFYITDYRSEGYKSAAKNESKSDSGSSTSKPAEASSSSGSSETKKSSPTDPSKGKKSPPKKS